MALSDRTPLLENGSTQQTQVTAPWTHRVLNSLKSGDEYPPILASFQFFFFSSLFNVFLVFIPLGAVAHFANWDAGLRFAFNFLAIVPLARLLGVATEQLSIPLGQSWAGLLSATFGNAVEIIVGLAALFQDELRIVQTSLVGSILSNILLVLGCSFIGGGWNTEVQNFNPIGAQVSSSLMTLSVIALILPAAYRATKAAENRPFDGETGAKILALLDPSSPPGEPPLPDDRTQRGLLIISHGTAIMLLLIYVAYLFFQLKTHAHLFKSSGEEEEEEEVAKMNPASAAIGLLAVTVMTSFSADWLVASIEETAKQYSIPKAFIGIILLPIVANAAEHVTSVWMAIKGKTEMPISICVGSSIQVIAFVIPLLVVIGWISGHNLTLYFANFETLALFLSVLLVNTLIMDGHTHYLEGLILLVLYVIIGIAYWVS